MSYSSFRDKPKLSERLRGKSGDEIFKEFKDQLEKDKKMFFDSSWSSPRSSMGRAGFPFDDFPTRRSTRSHLEDMAARHPVFAQHFRQDWGDDFPESDFKPFRHRERHGSGGSAANSGVSEDDTVSSAGSGPAFGDGADSVPINVVHKTKAYDSGGGGPAGGDAGVKTRKMPPYATRNTVDLAETQQQNDTQNAEGGRSQRSWSAPPDGRPANEKPKRYVSKIEITPMTPGSGNTPIITSSIPCSSQTSQADCHSSNQSQQPTCGGKPPMAPKYPSSQSSSQQSKSNNVRHIPIFVEGRDEPVVPKDHSFTSAGQSHSSPHGFQSRPESQPQQQNFGQFYRPRPQDFYPKRPATPPTQQPQPTTPPTCQTPPPQQSEKPKPQQKVQADPIAKVQSIQKAAEGMMELVENFSGTRNSKDYLYLDEMLTRNLLQLDDIETEGRDDIRQARKEAIRSINRCISVLESKAPAEGQQQVMDTEEIKEDSQCGEMEVEDSSKVEDGSTGDSKVPEKMEVSTEVSVTESGNMESQEKNIATSSTNVEEKMDSGSESKAEDTEPKMEVDKEDNCDVENGTQKDDKVEEGKSDSVEPKPSADSATGSSGETSAVSKS